MTAIEWTPISEYKPEFGKVLVWVPMFKRAEIAWFCEETGLWPADEPLFEGEPCNVGLPSHFALINGPE